MKNKNVVVCGHCGNEVTQELLHTVESHDILWSTKDPSEISKIEAHYHLVKCTTCEDISLYFENEWDNAYGNFDDMFRAYPIKKSFGSEIPLEISKTYKEAQRIKNVSPIAFAVLIGRTLEVICSDQKAKGKSLKNKLDSLVSTGKIPQQLADLADTLRFLRNQGAHATEYEIDHVEVSIIDDFLNAMIEYIYVAPSKLIKLKESIKNKKK
ncbi:MAG: DUF4145 domain-containing protein [Gilvibacter sp.]